MRLDFLWRREGLGQNVRDSLFGCDVYTFFLFVVYLTEETTLRARPTF